MAKTGTIVGKSCVARLLSVWCVGSQEQDLLCSAGACDAVAGLLAVSGVSCASSLTLPALDWLAAMCFENVNVSQTAAEARYVNIGRSAYQFIFCIL